jgi:hypothetical protein
VPSNALLLLAHAPTNKAPSTPLLVLSPTNQRAFVAVINKQFVQDTFNAFVAVFTNKSGRRCFGFSRNPIEGHRALYYAEILYFYKAMLPDYPHKIFADRRVNYCMLMVTLAMDSALAAAL